MTRDTFRCILKKCLAPRLEELGFRPVNYYYYKIEIDSEKFCYCGFIATTRGAKQEITEYCICIGDSTGSNFFVVNESAQPITKEQIINNFNKVEAFLLEE